MQIPILIEPMEGNRYRARGGEPLAISADGETKEEALENLREKLRARLCHGEIVVALDVPTEPHPLAEFVGMFKDDPWIDEWKKSMKAHRRKRDKDADLP
jgi:predicted RNase H-like HicB family nuclease